MMTSGLYPCAGWAEPIYELLNMAEYHIEIDPPRVVPVDVILAAPTLTGTKGEREKRTAFFVPPFSFPATISPSLPSVRVRV